MSSSKRVYVIKIGSDCENRLRVSLARYYSDSAKLLNARSTGHPINLTHLNLKHAITLLGTGMVYNLVVELCSERPPPTTNVYLLKRQFVLHCMRSLRNRPAHA
jgi:hypothetical protein